eukprot:gene7811-8653_t
MSNLITHDVFPIRAWQLTLYILIATTGIFGNGLIFVVLRTNQSLRSSAFGTYIGALALADILVCILCVPIYLTSTSWFTAHPMGAAGDAMCKTLSGYNILFFFATVSVYTLVAMAHERRVAICNPFYARTASTPRRAKIVVGLIWFFSLLLGLLSIIGEKVSDPKHASVGAHCTFSNAYGSDIIPKVVYVLVFSIQYVFPISFMVICFAFIKRELKAKNLRALRHPTPHIQAGEIATIKLRRKSVNTVLIVIVLFFFCWSMNQVIYFCLNFGLISIKWNGNVNQASVMLCFVSSCINPFVYAIRSKHFRDGFIDALSCKCLKRQRYTQLKP